MSSSQSSKSEVWDTHPLSKLLIISLFVAVLTVAFPLVFGVQRVDLYWRLLYPPLIVGALLYPFRISEIRTIIRKEILVYSVTFLCFIEFVGIERIMERPEVSELLVTALVGLISVSSWLGAARAVIEMLRVIINLITSSELPSSLISKVIYLLIMLKIGITGNDNPWKYTHGLHKNGGRWITQRESCHKTKPAIILKQGPGMQ